MQVKFNLKMNEEVEMINE